MKHQNKFHSQEEQKQSFSPEELLARQPREFAHADELLRHDSINTPVPPSLACRLRESIGPVPQKARPWWRRLFGG